MRITYCDHCSRRIDIEELDELIDEPAFCDQCRKLPEVIRNAPKPVIRQDRTSALRKTSGHLPVARIPARKAAEPRRQPTKASGLRRAVQAVVSLVW